MYTIYPQGCAWTASEQFETLCSRLRNSAFRYSQAPIDRGAGVTCQEWPTDSRKLLSQRTRKGFGGASNGSSDTLG